MRFAAALSLCFTVFFTAIIGLIHLRPYDDAELRAFLAAPDGCPMPCFIGIRPGVTTAEEAMAILEAHEWISAARMLEATDGRGIYAITAHWSGAQPRLIYSFDDLWMGVEDDTVQSIVITTDIPLGDVWLLLGAPAQGNIMADPTSELGASVTYRAVYSPLSFVFATFERCPAHSVWLGPTVWMLRGDLESFGEVDEYVPPSRMVAICRLLLNAN